MGAAAVQPDLFAAPPPAAASTLYERMSDIAAANAAAAIEAAPTAPNAQQLEWIRRKVPVWLKRAALLREGKPAAEQGADWRPFCLEGVVERLALRATGGDRLAALKLQLEACRPYEHPTAIGIVCHSGPIMAEIRTKLAAAIAEAEESIRAGALA